MPYFTGTVKYGLLVKYTDRQLAERVEGLMRSVLDPSVRLSVEKIGPALFKVRIGARRFGTPITFSLAWAGEGWPADIEQAIAAHLRPDVVAARRLAPGSLDRLDHAGISWADETGRASIKLLPSLLVMRDPRPSSTDAPARPAWPASRTSAAEAILAGGPATVAGVEAATGFSRGAVTRALNELERVGLLARPSAERGPHSMRIPNVVPLRDAWAPVAMQWAEISPVIRLHGLWADPGDLARSVLPDALASSRWALTGAAAADLVAPYLAGFTIVEAYVDLSEFAAEKLARLLDARPTDRGHRLEVRVFPPATAHGVRLVDNVPVVSDARLYADLIAKGGRFAEAATHLWEVEHGSAA
jgi:hypothetical protein